MTINNQQSINRNTETSRNSILEKFPKASLHKASISTRWM